MEVTISVALVLFGVPLLAYGATAVARRFWPSRRWTRFDHLCVAVVAKVRMWAWHLKELGGSGWRDLCYCPSSGQIEDPQCGGFDVCCSSPEKHISFKVRR